MTRVPAGAARPSERVDAALRQAVVAEMVEAGYAATSMEGVARRAGVGKAALYRRWPSKRDMVLAVLGQASRDPEDLPDTGTLFGDVLAYLRGGRTPLGRQAQILLPDLIATSARDQAFHDDVEATIYGPRRVLLRDMFRRAAFRGEVPEDLDLDTAVDVLAGSVFWRYTVKQHQITDDDTAELAATVLRAVGGSPPDHEPVVPATRPPG